jgi:hypothetical protein
MLWICLFNCYISVRDFKKEMRVRFSWLSKLVQGTLDTQDVCERMGKDKFSWVGGGSFGLRLFLSISFSRVPISESLSWARSAEESTGGEGEIGSISTAEDMAWG